MRFNACECHPNGAKKLFSSLITHEDDKPAFDPHAKTAIAGILESPSLSSQWQTHHRSRANDNAALSLAEQIRAIESDIDQHPYLLAFMQHLVEIEIEAIGPEKTSETAEIKSLRSNLEGLCAYLHTLPHSDIEIDQLPEDHRLILEMLKTQTGQQPFRPMHMIWNSAKHIGNHIATDAKNHPKSFTALLGTSLGLLYFMNMRMGGGGNTYIDPKVMQIDSLDVGALIDPTAPLSLDAQRVIGDVSLGCHDHLKMLVGDKGADFIKTTLDAVDLFPQHCSRVKTLAQNAQENLRAGYDFINTRIDVTVKDPAVDLMNTVATNGPFLEAFNKAADHTAEFIYAANAVENIVLHSIIFGSAVAGTVKIGHMEKEDFQAIRDRFGDFLYRTSATKPLNYLLCCSASTYAYIANGGYSPDMIWMGLGGLVAGELSHKAINAFKAPALVEQSTLSVRKDLATFADSAAIVSDVRAENHSKWDRFKKPAIAAGLTGAASALDFAITGGHYTGNVAGVLGVTIPFLAYNVPEDAAFHVIFGIAGAIVGGAWLCLEKGVKWSLDHFR